MNDLILHRDDDFFRADFLNLFEGYETFERYALVSLLNLTQERYGFLSRDALEVLSELMELSLDEICSVASFYSRFRFRKGGKYSVEVCIGTACHVKGAGNVYDKFYEILGLSESQEISADGLFDLKKVACLGCCMMAPAVKIGNSLYGPVDPIDCRSVLDSFLGSRGSSGEEEAVLKGTTAFLLCDCSSCRAAGAGEVRNEINRILKKGHRDGQLKRAACTGNSEASPMVTVLRGDQSSHTYFRVRPDQVRGLVEKYASPKKLGGRIAGTFRTLENILLNTEKPHSASDDIQNGHIRLATEGAGYLDPLDIDEYRREGGFLALQWALERSSEEVVERICRSGLRGRGGGGFRTAEKWRALLGNSGEKPYIVCNADEGDPGAFMDRMLLESFPFRIIEGMMIAALTFSAEKCLFYVRCEYPLAIDRLNEALEILKKHDYIGEKSSDGRLNVEFEIVEGAGAFVCGEETALLNSLEGRRGIPRPRPPFPTEAGFLNKPTLVNNVETFSLIPWLCREGAEAFNALGTDGSSGTKTFALAGKINRGGLIEVNLGTSIEEIIYEYGAGLPDGSELKAVQIGGPSGGCLPASLISLPVDYEALRETGAIMGSGGLVILDQHDCLVDLARYFIEFCRNESCGRCLWCRSGTESMRRILDRLCHGRGGEGDLEELKRLARLCKEFSQCGLGQSAPNPLLTSLKYFEEEYKAHLMGHCPAGVCKDLITYEIESGCIGCGLCVKACADDAITGEFWTVHEIDQEKCTKCDSCRKVCPEGAVHVR